MAFMCGRENEHDNVVVRSGWRKAQERQDDRKVAVARVKAPEEKRKIDREDMVIKEEHWCYLAERHAWRENDNFGREQGQEKKWDGDRKRYGNREREQ